MPVRLDREGPAGDGQDQPLRVREHGRVPGCAVGKNDAGALAACNAQNWARACTNFQCAGVPLYRQFVTKAEQDAGKTPSIPMMGMGMWQRDNLTANHGKYYIDTTLDKAQQEAINPGRVNGLNVFQKDQTYYVFQIFARPSTRITYQLYVGPGFNKDDAAQLWAVQTPLLGTILTFPKVSAWPTSWEKKYGTADEFPRMSSTPVVAAEASSPRSSCGSRRDISRA